MRRGNGDQPPSVRALNRDRVIEALREHGTASRADIARATGLSRTTISALIAELRDDGLIVERTDADAPATGNGAGRPPTLLALGAPAGLAVGIDFGKSHLAVALSDLSHQIVAEEWRVMREGYGAEEGMDLAVQLVDELLAAHDIDRADLVGAGLGLPAPVDATSGQVGSFAILPGWAGLRVVEEMERRLQLPVQVDNDANLGALAELYWGAGQNSQSLVYLKVASGIGAGIVIEGRLFHGAGGTAGEIGHLTVDEEGLLCRCGNRGCLETVAAGDALVRLVGQSLGEELTPEQIVEQAQAGEIGCTRAVADAGRHLGHAVGAVCNLLNPALVVVGGTIGQAGDLLLGEMREAVRRRAVAAAAADVEIVSGVLGERAEVLGAVALIVSDPAHQARTAGTSTSPRRAA